MKFLCDQMLVRLGRWLRAAGYDTAIVEEPIPDQEILKSAIHQNRCLITRDRGFKTAGNPFHKVVCLKSNSVDECVAELSKEIAVDWVKDPFSRCIVCNCPFEKASDEEIAKLPEGVLRLGSDFKKCPDCCKIYWMGSHTDRMLGQLKKWAAQAKGE